MLGLLLVTLVLPFAPSAKASTLVTQGLGWCTVGGCQSLSGSPPSISVDDLTGLSSGDVIIVLVGQQCNGCTPTAVLDVTDTAGTTISYQSPNEFNNNGEEFVSAYVGSYTSSNTTDSVSVNLEATPSSNEAIDVYVFIVQGIQASSPAGGGDTGQLDSSSCDCMTVIASSTISPPANGFALAIVAISADTAVHAASGFTFATEGSHYSIVQYTANPPSSSDLGFTTASDDNSQYYAYMYLAFEPLPTPTTSVSCLPTSIAVGSASMCTATLSGANGTITGETITWSQNGGTGSVSFLSTTCELSASDDCYVVVTGTGAGSPVVQASYPGDANNDPSLGNSSLPVTTPTLSLSAMQGPAGTTTTLSGANYSFSYTYNYCYEASTSSATACSDTYQFATDSSGNIPGSVSVVASGGSDGLVVVSDPATDDVVASSPFTISSTTLTLSPTQGPTGLSTTLSGGGYAASYTYNFCYEPSTGSAIACSSAHQFTTTGSGDIPGSEAVATSGSSNGLVVVSDPSTSAIISTDAFVITKPALSFAPTEAPGGSSVTVTGSGFSPNTGIGVFTFAGSTPSTQTCTSQTASTTGGFTCSFTVPNSASLGPNDVVASGSDVGSVPADTVSTTFTVGSPSPPVSLPSVVPETITVNFNFQGGPQLTGTLVSVEGSGILYNVPGYNAATDPFPYVQSACTIPGTNDIRLTGFGSAGAGDNSTEIFVSNWYDIVTSSQGWPSEPACTT